MSLLSIIIPSRVETYLQQTIDGLLSRAREDVEIIVVLDGYWPQTYNWDDPRIRVVHQGTAEKPLGMRAAINTGMNLALGEFVMKTDEHCLFDEGYDVKLKADCEDNWVVIPRRYRLDADKWEVIEDGRPPVDYMNISISDGEMHGWKSDQMHYDRKDILIDDTMSFQGSCYFMKKTFWDSTIGPMDDTNYGTFAQEAQEIGNKAWLSGGRVVVNKKTWYAHWHRGRTSRNFTNAQQKAFTEEEQKGRKYSLDFWTNNKWNKRTRDFDWLVTKFSSPQDLKD